MKKIFCILVLALFVSINGFAQSTKSADSISAENVVKHVSSTMNDAPSGTTWGVVKETKEECVVNTPVGKYSIKKKDGGYSLFGIWAKLESAKGSSYTVKSSVGTYVIDTKKCTVTKKSK